MKPYDYLIVGSGFFGSICAHELKKLGKRCLVIDKRNHIGGNCHTENRDEINVHIYGPHIFHTNSEKVWMWINQFVNFNNFVFRPVANYKNSIYSLPFNMFTFSKLWNISSPKEAIEIIEKQSSHIQSPKNLEEQAIKLVGTEIYEKLIKGYTEKQWKKDAKDLPKEIIKRLPVKFTYDNSYFDDKYQGIPIGGYSQIFEKLLNDIQVELNVDYLLDREYWDNKADKIIFTGPIDAFYEYEFGQLEYKTNNFVHEKLEIENFQGTSMMNYTEKDIPYTRIIEHKHFEFNKNNKCTWISYDYPVEYDYKTTDPYYPVNDEENNRKYTLYKNLSNQEKTVMFGGRLAEYKYYDMDDVIDSALNFIEKIKND